MAQPVQIGLGKSEPQVTHTDPVCKMLVTAETAAAEYDYKGQTYYFCNIGCKERFTADPEKYLIPSPVKDLPHDVEYTCPMHPEIIQVGPGICPLCGMAL